jgi:hypothetical protein
MKNEEKIRYRDLSTPLKIAVVGAWVAGILLTIAFIVGFIEGIVGV